MLFSATYFTPSQVVSICQTKFNLLRSRLYYKLFDGKYGADKKQINANPIDIFLKII